MKFKPDNRQDWRLWLKNNHASHSELWLVFVKVHTGRSNLSYNDAVEEALCFGWIDGVKRSIDDDHYMHRFTPRKADSNWSRSNKQRAQRLVESGQMSSAGLESIRLARNNGKWQNPVLPPRELSMPNELKEKLENCPHARTFFASLAPSYRKQYVSWVAAAKKPATRQRRAEESIKLLSAGKKLGMR